MVWRCCEVFCRVSKKITDSNTTYLLTHYQWSIPKNTKTSNCFDTNLCLFNPIFNPTIICMSVIKTQICTRVRELCDCIVQRTTAMATKQRQRQHHMSVSCPSCAGARASFRTVCCCCRQQHTTVRAICHHAQAHELFILATTAKNVDDKTLLCKRMSYLLVAIVHKRTSY